MEGESSKTGTWSKVAPADDPLSSSGGEWDQYYKDEELRHEIYKDVKRTYSTFSFFQQPVRKPPPEHIRKPGNPPSTSSPSTSSKASSGMSAELLESGGSEDEHKDKEGWWISPDKSG